MNKIEAYAELLLNSDAETTKGELASISTSVQLFELVQLMTGEEIKEAIALYHKIKPQKR
jgi:leucyl aminopeptidase (aminopeptidase T)